MSYTNKIKRLEQIKQILREYDGAGRGLSRSAIAQQILQRFPGSGDLKSVENTVQNYLSTYKNVEFLNTRRGFWTLALLGGSSRDSLTSSEDIELQPMNRGSPSTQVNSEAGPPGEAPSLTPDNIAHPRTQPPPFTWSVPHTHQTDEMNAAPFPTVSYTSMSAPNYLTSLHVSSGRRNTINAGSGTWSDPGVSQSSRSSSYHPFPSLPIFYSNSAANHASGVLSTSPPNEAHQITTPRSFISATAHGSSYGSFEGQAAFPLSSASASFAVGNHQPVFDLQPQSTYHLPRREGYCPMCAQPLQGGASFSAVIQNGSDRF